LFPTRSVCSVGSVVHDLKCALPLISPPTIFLAAVTKMEHN